MSSAMDRELGLDGQFCLCVEHGSAWI